MLAGITLGEGLAIASPILAALVTAVVFMFRAYIKEKDERYSELKDRFDTLDKVSIGLASTGQQVIGQVLQSQGLQPTIPVPAVVPKTNSPVTERQVMDARVDTLRAVQAAMLNDAQRAFPDTIHPLHPVTAKEVEDGMTEISNGGKEPLGTIQAEGTVQAKGGKVPVSIEGSIKPTEEKQ